MHNPITINVIYVVNNLTVGGVSEVIKHSLRNLSARFKIIIVSLNKDISNWDSNLPTKIKVFDIPDNFKYRLRDYARDSFLGKRIKKNYQPVIDFIVEENPDIIHFHTLPRFLKIGEFIKRKINCELVFTDHSVRISKNEFPSYINFGMGLSYRILYRQYNLITVSPSVEKVAKQFRFINDRKIYLRLNNVVDTAFFKSDLGKQNKDELPVVFIYVSRISNRKGHKDLINAWTKIDSQKKRELWIVGPDDMNEEIHRLVYGIKDDRIKFLGHRKDIKELLEKADIGVFPSYKEGLPLALMEKMAMQLPVIVSKIDELTSIISDNYNGLVFPLGNTKKLAQKMEIVLESKELRKVLGLKARETVELKYNPKNNIGKLEKFYLSLLN